MRLALSLFTRFEGKQDKKAPTATPDTHIKTGKQKNKQQSNQNMVLEVESMIGSSNAATLSKPDPLEEEAEETTTTTAKGGSATTQQQPTSSKKKSGAVKKAAAAEEPKDDKENTAATAAAAPKKGGEDKKATVAAATAPAATTPAAITTNKGRQPAAQQQQPQQQAYQPRTPPFQPYTGIPPFKQLMENNLQDWPPGRGLTFIRPCPSGTASLEKLAMLKNCPQILAYIQSFSGADWMEATFTPQPCIRITASTDLHGGRATAEAILRLSDEMILQWLHRFDPSMPIWAMFVCPSVLSGLMVGKLAVNLKKVEETSQARVWAAPRDLESQYVSFFICSNNYEATREAYAMLESRAHNQMDMAMQNVHVLQQQQQQQQPQVPAAAPTICTPTHAAVAAAVAAATKELVATPVSSDDDTSSTDTEPSTQQPTRGGSPPATNKGGKGSSPKGVTRSVSGGGEAANHQAASPEKKKEEEGAAEEEEEEEEEEANPKAETTSEEEDHKVEESSSSSA